MNKIVESYKKECLVLDTSSVYQFASWAIDKTKDHPIFDESEEQDWSDELYEALEILGIDVEDFNNEWNMLCS